MSAPTSHSTTSHGHAPHVQHHFADGEQQADAAKLGMWVFLLTEILMFGGLFCAYAIYRTWKPEVFYNAHLVLDIGMGALNTVVLIVSSVTMALAIREIQHGRRGTTIAYLWATLALAGTFLVVKYFEYAHKIHEGQLPGSLYSFQGIEGTNPHQFFSIYFMMTGLHGSHVVAGMVMIGWLIYRTSKGAYNANYYTPIENTGLFWHLVDLVWIFLFPLLYLIPK